ncbi:hypothetical protein [Actinomyces culturomici]|uniref:hypothetical protein n=1 Tax=Actinomyces culturomici TaxID=1926276 RepID=UPI000E208135|nr:hypothetical protein [Actinomyces culturomici]
MTTTELNTEKLAQASKTLEDSTSEQASRSVTDAATINGYQCSSKWGAEDGPASFQGRYTDYLLYLEHELGVMRDQLDGFVRATRSTAEAFKENEEDTAGAARKMEENLTEISSNTRDVETDTRTEASYKENEGAEATAFEDAAEKAEAARPAVPAGPGYARAGGFPVAE